MPFNKNEIIVWCDELYRVRADYGDSGVVEVLGDGVEVPFRWTFEGETARLATREELTTHATRYPLLVPHLQGSLGSAP